MGVLVIGTRLLKDMEFASFKQNRATYIEKNDELIMLLRYLKSHSWIANSLIS